jgi:hypothetical protein
MFRHADIPTVPVGGVVHGRLGYRLRGWRDCR